MNIVDPTICEWSEAQFFIFSENIWGNFIYYSHFFPSLAGLLIAFIVFINAPKYKPAQALFVTSIFFAVWSFLDLILWASERSDVIMFVWSILIYFDILIYISAFYFTYSYFNKKFPGILYQILTLILFLPLFLFSHTKLNLIAFDFTNCWREALEGPLWTHYVYIVELLIVLGIVTTAILYLRNNYHRSKEILLLTSGVVLFLMTFSFGNILGAIETDWEIGQVGLFGMPVFASMLAYVIIKYQTFKVKIFAAEALFAGMSLLLVSQLFVRTIENARTITALSIVLFLGLGIFLIRSVRREIEQREQIEKLATSLEKANERLKGLDKQKSEFVSIASHQLRSPLTAMRGYASMMIEGSFGPITDKQKQVLAQIQDSGKMMASSIEDYLSISRIESGNMKYEMSEFNLKDLTQNLVEELQGEAAKAGLILHFASEVDGEGVVNADKGKVFQIIHNLVNNSLKYTPKGTVTVLIKDDTATKTISVNISDTGIGMNQATIAKLFEKFSRADNANSVNIKGTGLGLYVARLLARAMKGDVSAHSEGDNKGSTFTFTIPYVR